MTPFRGEAGTFGERIVNEPPKDVGGKKPEVGEKTEQEPTRQAQQLAVEVRELLRSDLRLERDNRQAQPEANRTFAADYDTDLVADGSEQVSLTVGPMGGVAEQARFDFAHRIRDPKTNEFAEVRFHVEPNQPITVAEAGAQSSAEANQFEQQVLFDKLSALKRLTEARLAQLKQAGEMT